MSCTTINATRRGLASVGRSMYAGKCGGFPSRSRGTARRHFSVTQRSMRSDSVQTDGSSFSRRTLPRNVGVIIVPQQSNYIIERFGRFHRMLGPGLQLLVPLIDRVSYVHSLKEEVISVTNQTAITRDNVTIHIDGVLYVKVEDAKAASYGVENPYRALSLLAQTTMRSELGKLTLDKTFEERETLNALIVAGLNEAAKPWGIRCLRYEIRDITPPASVRKAMELQAEAERRKRAQVLQSEGERESDVNVAEGHKKSAILASEADKFEKVNAARGEANAILARAKAISEGVLLIAEAIRTHPRGEDAVALRIAEQYVGSFQKLAGKGNAIIVPAASGSGGASAGGVLGSIVAQALAVTNTMQSARDGGVRNVSMDGTNEFDEVTRS